MTKAELINEMAEVLESPKEAQAAIESLLSNITAALKKGESVTVTGLGTFKVSKRKAREGRNPRTGEKIKIKSKNVAQFAPGKALKEAVN